RNATAGPRRTRRCTRPRGHAGFPGVPEALLFGILEVPGHGEVAAVTQPPGVFRQQPTDEPPDLSACGLGLLLRPSGRAAARPTRRRRSGGAVPAVENPGDGNRL